MYNYLIIFCFTLFYTSVFYPRKSVPDFRGFFAEICGSNTPKERCILQNIFYLCLAVRMGSDILLAEVFRFYS